ncbi:uncharacterized protein LOC135490670 isoform X2 [Lineus longissimus]|uniref:uncharacterized protein LOC135490670 isoform X2 n=1 Tax=Lineus longissimus TaxID=88925 RepID=UPI00315DA169
MSQPSNEVKNSYWMDLEGLKRSMALLVTEKKLAIAEMVTDRHSQIKKYLRDKWPGVQHWFDCWHIAKGSKAHKELTLILTQKILLKDIRKVSPGVQTSSLESYHKIVGYFAPKSRHFFYEPMKARLLLATLHFNENSNRKQRMGQDEQPQWSISYPKGRGGAAVAKEVKIESTYDYVQLILEDLLKRR